MYSVSFISSWIINLSFLIRSSGAVPVSLGSNCPTGQFECLSDAHCIPTDWVCDYSFDCQDKSDEVGCQEETTPNSVPVECSQNEFMCPSDRYCISLDWVCDDSVDCEDNSDELDCFFVKCGENEDRCKKTGHCIKQEYICDGESDCIDSTDEENCPSPTTTAISTKTDKMEETTEISSFTTDLATKDFIQNQMTELMTADSDPITTTFSSRLSSDYDDLLSTKHIILESDLEQDQLFLPVMEANENNATSYNISYYNETFISYQNFPILSEVELSFDENATWMLPYETSDIPELSKISSAKNNEGEDLFMSTLLFNSTDDIISDNTPSYMYESEGVFDKEESLNDIQTTLINLPSISPEKMSPTQSPLIISEDLSLFFPKFFTFGPSPRIPQSTTLTTLVSPFITTSPTITPITTTTPTTTTPTPTTTTTTTTPATTTTPTTTTTTTTTTTPYDPCRRGEFYCRVDNACIPVEWRCDHTKDCWDGSDEENCNLVNCPSEMIQCQDTGQCIYHAWLCDGGYDCDTGSDELYCK